ncbi:MAG: SDR family NAD(P)-dependent oxidoreductase, partial [Eubacteriales bacterium]|nr:SDR family NAD(P)-dependent oxidoreductase [Eubacteriales bacterium]
NTQGLKSIQRGLERQFGVTVTTAACDLTRDESVDALLQTIDLHGIHFDMLLNVAGLDFEGGFLERERKDIVHIISLNNEATLRITHAILSRRRDAHPFYLLFTSSLASMYPMPLKATYAASKRFLLDIAVALREELKVQRVNVLALCPGGLATTREAMRGIAAQGFWGGATTNPLEIISTQTIRRLEKRGGIYIPGALNRVLTFFGKLLPRRWAAAAIYRRWNKAQERWSTVDASSGGAA